ncbi:MAG: hypothetical protein P8M33_07350 [Flavobacteriaceae bacterium]|nr:hypothetical protein [Flavobacteriaceae bacterium]MDG2447698.1 hypothetical protein [Flavobacteriaceae bacterium]
MVNLGKVLRYNSKFIEL